MSHIPDGRDERLTVVSIDLCSPIVSLARTKETGGVAQEAYQRADMYRSSSLNAPCGSRM